jgi:creatinine amidohydrolase
MPRFADLTWEEIRDYIDRGAIAILPLGCTEQQGPHLAIDRDSRFVTELCMQASQLAGDAGVYL